MNIISRKEAISQGLKFYFTGKSCKRGHVAERYTSNCGCLACHEESMSSRTSEYHTYFSNRWRTNNPELAKKLHKKYRNSSNGRKVRNKWEREKGSYRKTSRGRAAKNANSAKRRAIIKQATPLWYEKYSVLLMYQKREELSKIWDIELEVDHIIPLQSNVVCGLHCWDNLQLLENTINNQKHSKFVKDW